MKTMSISVYKVNEYQLKGIHLYDVNFHALKEKSSSYGGHYTHYLTNIYQGIWVDE